MNTQEIWNCEKPVTELLNLIQPDWIEYELTAMDIASICNGGCASGSYMPAVTYHKALRTMSLHGDDILKYIENVMGELPAIPKGESWGGMACLFLSHAVELWAGDVMAQLESLEGEEA
jgi:hypothetical protein